MRITDKLRKTDKARLSYERSASGSSLTVLLQNCSTPPQIKVSPSLTRSEHLGKKAAREDEVKEEKKDEGKTSPRRARSFHRNSVELGQPEQSDKRIVCIVSPEYGKSLTAIQQYEASLEQKARDARAAKQRQFQEQMTLLQQEADQNAQVIEQAACQQFQQQVQHLEWRHKSQAEEMVKRHLELKETHEQRKQVHNACIQEAEVTKQKLKEEEARQRALESKQRLDMIVKAVTDLNKLCVKVQTTYSSCPHQQFISDAGKKALSLLQQLVTTAEQTQTSCQEAGETTPDNVTKLQRILEQARNAYEFVKQEIEKAVAAGAKHAAEELAKQQQAAAATQPSATSTASTAAPGTVPSPSASATGASAIAAEDLCVDIEAFKQYTVLQNRLKAAEQVAEKLSSTPELKKLKFDIMKAVNTAINAISGASGDNLREKLDHLLRLLSGQSVVVSGRRVSINNNPEAILFCKYLIGKMFVKKADEQVSSKHDSAFPIAMVAVGLWREHPDLGDLLLAHFQQACPYIVPYYIPKQDGESNEDHLKARGYRFEDGTVEKQDKFLKRMSGFMRLYTAIMVSAPPRGQHPHGVENAWVFLSRIMNITPEPDITMAMIFDLLQVTGHVLFREYRKQFQKLLHCLVKEVLPKLRNVASPLGSGALARLELLLESSIKHQGNIAEPEGFLHASFWMS